MAVDSAGVMGEDEGRSHFVGGQADVHKRREVPVAVLRVVKHVDPDGQVRPATGRGRLRVPSVDRAQTKPHGQAYRCRCVCSVYIVEHILLLQRQLQSNSVAQIPAYSLYPLLNSKYIITLCE